MSKLSPLRFAKSNTYLYPTEISKSVPKAYKDTGKRLRDALKLNDYEAVEKALEDTRLDKGSTQWVYISGIFAQHLFKAIETFDFWVLEEFSEWKKHSPFVHRHETEEELAPIDLNRKLILKRKYSEFVSIATLFFKKIQSCLPAEEVSPSYAYDESTPDKTIEECLYLFDKGLGVLKESNIDVVYMVGYMGWAGNHLQYWNDPRFHQVYQAHEGIAFPTVNDNPAVFHTDTYEYYGWRHSGNNSKQAGLEYIKPMCLEKGLELGLRFSNLSSSRGQKEMTQHFLDFFAEVKDPEKMWSILKNHDESTGDVAREKALSFVFSPQALLEFFGNAWDIKESLKDVNKNEKNLTNKQVNLKYLKQKWKKYAPIYETLRIKAHQDGLDQKPMCLFYRYWDQEQDKPQLLFDEKHRRENEGNNAGYVYQFLEEVMLNHTLIPAEIKKAKVRLENRF